MCLHLADRQLTHIVQNQHYMRGLALLDWCLSQRADFAPTDLDALALLAEHSATVPQCKTVLQAIENVLALQPAPSLPANLKQQALLLSGTKLKDEKRYAKLSGQLAPHGSTTP